jgi:hypothetical protein
MKQSKRRPIMKIYTTLKILGVFALFIILGIDSGHAQLAKVHGQVIDKDGKAAVGASVKLLRGGAPIAGDLTDDKGKYEIAKIDPGSYILEVYDGERKAHYSLTLSHGETQPMQLDMAIAYEEGAEAGPAFGTNVKGFFVYPADKEIFSVDPINPWVITKLELKTRAATRGSLEDLAAGAGGIVQADHGDPLSIGGARPEGTAVYVDGMKIRGSSQMSLVAIEQLAVLNSGIPAEFGDVTGGVISVTTSNPGMNGYFGPKNPNKVRKAIRKKHKEMNEKGDEGFVPTANDFASL